MNPRRLIAAALLALVSLAPVAACAVTEDAGNRWHEVDGNRWH